MKWDAQALLIGIFLGALVLPVVDRRLRPEQWEHVKSELRNPERFPEAPLDLVTTKRWPERFEAWYDDAFGTRDQLIRLANLQAVALFAKAPSAFHLMGRQGFVMFAGHDSQAIWRGRRPLSEEHLEAWCQAIRERRERFAAEGIRYWFCVAPNKETIYPDMLPAGEERHGETPLMQLDRVLRERAEPAWVDLRPALESERGHDRPELDDWTYLRLGSHYSYRGGTAVSIALAERGRAEGLDFPVLARDRWHCNAEQDGDIEDCIPLTWHLGERDMEPAWRMSLDGSRARVLERSAEQFPMRMSLSGPEGAPRVALVHDSFGQWTRGTLAEFCSRLDTRWQYYLPMGEIVVLRPDLVIQLVTERHLRNRPEPLELLLRTLTRGTFRALDRVEPYEGWQQRLRPHLETRLLAEPGGEVAIDCAVGQDKFYYPLPQLSSGSLPALRIELSAPVAGRMYVWFQTREDPKYQKVRRLIVPIEAGRHEHCFVIPTEAPPGDLLIQPLDAHERVVIHALELRPLREAGR
jgi:alginate O-acetyltransferase complex protein AlgJ